MTLVFFPQPKSLAVENVYAVTNASVDEID